MAADTVITVLFRRLPSVARTKLSLSPSAYSVLLVYRMETLEVNRTVKSITDDIAEARIEAGKSVYYRHF